MKSFDFAATFLSDDVAIIPLDELDSNLGESMTPHSITVFNTLEETVLIADWIS